MDGERFTDLDQKPNGMVDMWDMGPEKPIAPNPPPEPKPTGHKADDAVAQQQYDDAVEDYKKELKSYSAQKKEYDGWRQNAGGPVKREVWPIDANRAIDEFPGRYRKTLPAGAKPGKAQVEADERAVEQAAETKRIKERDPHMGKGAPS
jgi:hypothetical protein